MRAFPRPAGSYRLLQLLQPTAPPPRARRPDPGRGLLVYTTDGTNSCMTSGQSPMNLMKLSRRTRPPLRFIRMEGKMPGDVRMNLELHLSVEGSPNWGRCGDRFHPVRESGIEPWTGRHIESAIGPSSANIHQNGSPTMKRSGCQSVLSMATEAMGMQCLIIAAGHGSRLRQKGDSKPLTPIAGVPLIERVIRSAMEAGADEFYVVVGRESNLVCDFLERLAKRLVIGITPLVNEDWERENGHSVLKARGVLQEPFLLLMADHLFDPELVRDLTTHSLPDVEVALVVDSDIHNPLIDLDDVTRVRVEDGRIRDIGKGLTDFNGFDTGIFLCSSAIFEALEQDREDDGEVTLSGAIRILAEDGRARAVSSNGFWIDVDDPASFKKAEKALLGRLRDKPTDGPVSRYLNRPLP